jgi:hypothetical protein
MNHTANHNLKAMLKRHEDLRLVFSTEPELREYSSKLRQEIPVVAVVGLQSHGKSKLLSRLTGVSLPSAMGETCTTRPLKLIMRKGGTTERTYKFKSHDLSPNGFSPIAEASVNSAIQAAMLKGPGGEPDARIRDEMMYLEIRGANEVDLDLVDLPGMHQKEDKETIEALLRRWIIVATSSSWRMTSQATLGTALCTWMRCV